MSNRLLPLVRGRPHFLQPSQQILHGVAKLIYKYNIPL
jgi:hypothetical protein